MESKKSLLENSHFHKRSQPSIGWQIYKAFFKLRLKSVMFYISYIIGIGITLIMLALPKTLSSFYVLSYDPDRTFSSAVGIPSDWELYIWDDSQDTKVFVHPINNITVGAIKSCLGMTKYGDHGYEFINYSIQGADSFATLANLVKENAPAIGYMFDYDIEKMVNKIQIISRADGTIYADAQEICLQYYFMNLTENNLTFDINSQNFQSPWEIYLMNVLQSGLVFHFSYLFIIIMTVVTIFELYEQKLALLLKISGARRLTLWSSILLVDFTCIVVFSILSSGIMAGTTLLSNTNYLILLANVFFCIIGVFAQCLCFSLILNKASYIKYLLLIFMGLAAAFGTTVPFDVMKNLSTSAHYAIMSFFPQYSSMQILQNIDFALVKNQTLSFSNINDCYQIETNTCIGFFIVSILIYFMFYMIITNRDVVFHPSEWKKLFRHYSKIESYTNERVKAIKIDDISKTYKSHSHVVKALDHVSFEVDKGEVILLIGPNGSGKTTLINSMTGVIDADSGSLELFGSKATGFHEMQDYIGICTQENILFPNMSVYENLHLFGAIRGCPEDVINEEIERLADGLALAECLSLKAGTLSGGQKRKLCIAIAFIGDPPIVILDEPTSGIDVSTRQTIWKTISAFSSTTSFVTSHSLEEAESVSSRIFVMRNGQLIFQGTASELRRQNNCGYIFKAIGDNVDYDSLVSYMKSVIPDVEQNPERQNIITIPVNDSIVNILEYIDQSKEKFNLDDYTMTAEAIEDVLLRLIADDE